MEAAFLADAATRETRDGDEQSQQSRAFGGGMRDFTVPHPVFKDNVGVALDPLISPIPLIEDDLLSPAPKRTEEIAPQMVVPTRPPLGKGKSYPVSFVLLIEETTEKTAAASVELVAVSNTGRLWADTRRDKKREPDSSRGSAASYCTLDTPKKDGSAGGESFLAALDPTIVSPEKPTAPENPQPNTNERVIQINSAPEMGQAEDIHVYVSVKELPSVVGLRCSLVVLDSTGSVNEPPLQTESLGVNGAMWEVGVFRIQPGQRGRWVDNAEQQHTSPWTLMKPLPMTSSNYGAETPAIGRQSEPLRLGVSEDPQSRISKVKNKIYGKSKRIIFYTLTLDDLKGFFNLPRDEVARELGICVTLLKKICRRNGIKQWPYRKLKNIDARIAALEHKSASMNASAAPDAWTREYASSIEVLKRERENVISLQETSLTTL
mmetsp:Transcript_18791/g.46164  ORF Transcript_18791/g.46164 Transcript_18791/m.46164 type:complete len:435 (+) Transcript_18791:567-1871(+)|eukprot:CAMPEP_0198329106 /NCGR_PEP_ID=MMETSP1450-20131203/15939_1 /TAXON_ID=753684 ORGANISM="Madagascaria erythrocladiodes, Strain CCMP3234" /NCGR_SAMPLE_ID=MMETSP1450 /ASSEMBLY_ACC=CAM_ASM_001115 /LENGTH=434 /DNA_ID=CAMNT_0044033291 /DNA_START=545 /DNA_END=1849 /DNA_ORIENTATION=-